MATASEERRRRVAQLAEQLRGWEGGAEEPSGGGVSSGCSELDALLPRRGFSAGALVEWVAAQAGAGATTLALAAARTVCGDDGWLVVIDEPGE